MDAFLFSHCKTEQQEKCKPSRGRALKQSGNGHFSQSARFPHVKVNTPRRNVLVNDGGTGAERDSCSTISPGEMHWLQATQFPVSGGAFR